MQRLVAIRLLEETGLTSTLRIVQQPITSFSQDFCFAVTEGDRDTLSLLNEGLALVIADGTHRRLHSKWFAALELPSDRRIVIGGDANYPPFEFLDEKGRPAGYNVELVRAIAEAVGMDVEIRLGRWTEIIHGLELGEIDGIEGMFYSPERERLFDFSQAHTVNHCVSVVRRGVGAPPEDVAALAGLSLVVQEGDIMHAFAREQGLTNRLTVVASQEDALRAVSEGRQDCALVARMTALYWIEKLRLDDLAVGRTPLLSPEYCFAVPNGSKALLAQLSEGLKVLEQNGEYRRIRDKWMGAYMGGRPTVRAVLGYLAIVVIPLLFVLALVLLWSWALRRQVAKRTAELRLSEQELDAQYTLLRVAGETVRFGGWSVDVATGKVTWSDVVARIHGMEPGYSPHVDEGIGFYAPEWREKITEVYTQCVTDGVPYDEELEIINRAGERVWVRTVAQAVKDQNGSIVRVEGSFQDITERKQREDQSLHLTQVLRAIRDVNQLITSRERSRRVVASGLRQPHWYARLPFGMDRPANGGG